MPPAWGRRAVTGETVKPRHLWQGQRGARLPVFLDDGKQLGIGRSRRIVSRVLGWLRAGGDHLALVTNGRQWRLVFAGLDYDAWCEWDLELWFEEGELSPQVTALRTLLQGALWTPEAEGAEPPLLQAIRDTRKGQAELSEVLGERVREAVEILIRAHGDALSSLGETDDIQEYVEDLAEDAGAPAPDADEIKEMFGASPAEIYRAACRVAMRLVVILFAESRDLLPRDNPLYHESYGLHGLLERLERAAARGRNLAGSFGAWPRVLALFALVREGSHHPDLPVTAYGGDLFAPGTMEADDGVSRALRVYEQACFGHEVMPDRDVHEMLRLLTRTTIRIRQGPSSVRAVAPVDFSDLSSEYIGILYEGLLDYELKTAPAGDPVIFLSVGDQPALPLSRLEAMDDQALRTLFEKLKEKSAAADDLPEEEATAADASEPEEDTADAAAPEDESLLADSEDAGRAEDGPPEHAAVVPDERQRNRTRAETWARRAAQAARLLKKPRGRDTPERRLAFDSRLAAKAKTARRPCRPPRRVVPRPLGRHAQGLGQLLHAPRPRGADRAAHIAPARLRPAGRRGRQARRGRAAGPLDTQAARADPRPDGLRSRVRLRNVSAGRAPLPDRCPLRRAPASRPSPAGRRSLYSCACSASGTRRATTPTTPAWPTS